MMVLSCDGLEDLDLQNADSGLLCVGFDMGWPAAREQVLSIPGRDGTVDRTTRFDARSVSLELAVTSGTLGDRADVLARLAPFMHVARRPWLTYADEGTQAVRRVMLAPRALNVPRQGESITSAQAQFVAPDGVAVGVDPVAFTLAPMSAALTGRTYSLTFDRAYPAGHSSGPVSVPIFGDASPKVTANIYGPCTAPKLSVTQNGETWVIVAALSSVTINAGDFLAVDPSNRTVTLNGEGGASRFSWVDHAVSTWRLPMPGWCDLSFECSSSGADRKSVV